MKKAIIIYRIMGIIMLVACFAFGVFLPKQISIINFVLPACSLVVFGIYSFILKGKSVKDILLNNIYLSHILVLFTIIQAMIIFKIDIITAIIIIFIGLLMNVFLVMSLRLMFNKIGVNNAEN